MTAPLFAFDQLAACAEREVRQRQRVYARQVELGRMRQDKADNEIAMMQAIAAHLRKRAERGTLFGDGR
jgi:hypothetical protein